MASDPARYTYLPLIDRPHISWPNGKRLAVWVVPNIEYYELNPSPNAGRPFYQRPNPDVLAYATRDYGNRVGVWRLFDAMDRFGIRGSVSLNAGLCDHIPEIIEGCAARGWELFSHGVYNTRLIYGMDEAQVREVIRVSLDKIRTCSGQTVRGWLAPALSTTETFFELLPEHGITYSIDFVHDDQPLPLTVKSGRLISMPYSAGINDIGIMGFRGLPPDSFAAMVKSCFDQLYEESAENGMVMCLPLHPFVIGQAHRIDALIDIFTHMKRHEDVWFATGSEIADWYLAHHYDEAVAFLSAQSQGGANARA